MKRDWILKPFAVVLLVALFAWAGSQSARAQTFPAEIQQFWSQLRTGAIAFSTGRVQTSGYLNFGTTVGTNGYGFRDLAGTIQVKNSGGSWANILFNGGTFNNPIFTGQWTVNGSLCAAGEVVQGGSPTTCTSTPTITSLTIGNGTTTAPSIHGTVATSGFLFDTAPAAGPRLSLYDTSIGAIYGLLSNSFEDTNLTGRGLQVIGRTTSLNDNGTIVLRPQATTPVAWNIHPAMLFGSYDGGYDIGTAEHWAAFCYSTGVSWCDFGGSLNGIGERKPMWEMMGNSTIQHNVIRSSTQSIDNVSTIGYSLNNTWTSTAGFPTQWSPAFAWCGSAWKSNATAASQADCFKAENRTLTGSTVTTQTWALGSSVNGGAYTDVLTVTSAGVLSGPTYASSGSGMAVANVGANSCGTTTATIAGNNNAFVITVGATAGTQCRVAFTFAAGTEWDCASNDDTTTVAVRTTPVDTTHTDLIGTFTAGDKVTGICFPR